MAQVCEATGYVQVVLPDGTKLPVVNDARTPAPIPACMKWAEAPASPTVNLELVDFGIAFSAGVALVMLFGAFGFLLRSMFQVVHHTFNVED